ncbi:GNAT family N-acetyltransferase [Streptacidiphilus jiangxiensis]|uniref:Protein N-acetyltransferase, RimJ/RimL family n=1 Tax=Streptacidiphilus jiangxiensis TaxID=235985 RepID=A0A1H7HSD2_STRJI|nr:GNAT family protein [Streptacidiphilus jiangxiensis]SEK52442.1 Protein N-acetyltransferase, RimJ/RimL family [Streptacidiphilus jiangxiensis]
MSDHDLDDGVVRLRIWAASDAGWYAESVRESLIQRFTTDPPTLDAAEVRMAIVRMRASVDREGLLVADAVTGERLGNIALRHDGQSGEVSYWVAAEARGRGVATRAVGLFTTWAFRETGVRELWLRAHRDNVASQRVAVRAGFHRDPTRDTSKQIKGELWPLLGYTLRRPD